jgi:hypothetical protein
MGLFFRIPAFVITIIFGVWGFLGCLGVVGKHFGFFGKVAAIFLAPLTAIVVPWYEAFASSNWSLVILIYGGGFVAGILNAIGNAIDKK